MKQVNYSRQRECIYHFLAGRRDHPSAEMVYQSIRKQIPSISLGTVYRNLGLLAELGRIRRLTDGNGIDRFDADLTPHHHFICRSCGCVQDIIMQDANAINAQAAKCFDGKIESNDIYFYGKCRSCCGTES